MKRFWNKVKKTDYCWLWTAYTNSDGYGQFWFRGTMGKAHRFSWILHNGEIPKGVCVLHIECDNPPCVNPDHLELGTDADNMQDCLKKGRHGNTKKTLCPKGHSYTGDNLYIVPNNGKRQCRECKRINDRKYYRERKKQKGPTA